MFIRSHKLLLSVLNCLFFVVCLFVCLVGWLVGWLALVDLIVEPSFIFYSMKIIHICFCLLSFVVLCFFACVFCGLFDCLFRWLVAY